MVTQDRGITASAAPQRFSFDPRCHAGRVAHISCNAQLAGAVAGFLAPAVRLPVRRAFSRDIGLQFTRSSADPATPLLST
jgi:hypothetical protein